MKERPQISVVETIPGRIFKLMVSKKIFSHTDAQGTLWRLTDAAGACDNDEKKPDYKHKFVLCCRRADTSPGERPTMFWQFTVKHDDMQ